MTQPSLLFFLLLNAATAHTDDTLRLLFIGNSHTYVNNIPLTVEEMARSAGRPCYTWSATVGGYRLEEHTLHQPTLDAIAAGSWDHVILQEQSQVPTIPYWRDSSMYPAVRLLDSLARGVGAQTMLYMTWGWRDGGTMVYLGDSSPDFRDYFEMQDSVTAAYQRIGDGIGAVMSPVGRAWRRGRELDSTAALWQSDACHSTPFGAYLAACTFYSVLFDEPATGRYVAPYVSDTEAVFCWNVSWEVVSGIDEDEDPSEVGASPSLTALPIPCRAPALVRLSDLRFGPLIPDMLSVLDPAGRLVLSVRVDVRNQSVMVPLLPAGVYMLRLGPARGRLVVTR
jgi:hypothetical protein